MPYLAARQFEDKGVTYSPGDVVPEDVEQWPTYHAVLDMGWITLVSDDQLETRQAALRGASAGQVPAGDDGEALRSRQQRPASQQPPSDQPDVPDAAQAPDAAPKPRAKPGAKPQGGKPKTTRSRVSASA